MPSSCLYNDLRWVYSMNIPMLVKKKKKKKKKKIPANKFVRENVII
jgi:hypothetical protein